MTHLALTLALIYVVFLFGYFWGRHQVVKEIREMTEELNKED